MNGGEKQKAFSMQGNGATYATGADSISAPVTLVPTGVEPGQGADEGVVKMEVAETEEKRKREKREKKERRKSEKLAAGEAKADGEEVASPKKEKKEKKEKVSPSVFCSLPWSPYLDAPTTRDGSRPKLRTLTLPTEQKRSRDDDSESPKKKKSKKEKSA